MPIYEVTGNAQSRFVQAAALLHLLDPVRGEPTAYGLDQDSNTLEQNRERLLKRKFLDSFALIYAKKKDSDTVSAACLEEGFPEGTIVRVASNQGVAKSTLFELRELMTILNGVASGEYTASDKESEVLVRIISLDIVRIRSYLKDIHSVSDDVRDIIEGSTSGPAFLQIDYVITFPEWIAHVFTMRDLPSEPTPESLVDHIRWALEARRTYLACLQALFPSALPRWVYAIFKLGRYAIASMAFLHFTSEFSTLFNPMLVEPVQAPSTIRLTCSGKEMPLTSVVRRLTSGQEDPEAYFRDVCTLHLPVHAEIQLLNFYDSNPKRRPSFRFIGVSKKSCFLCQWFLARHPLSFNVSSCHQKLYLNWRPPPAADIAVYRQYKTIVTDLSKAMESVVKQELQNRLGLRRPVPPDSTAGVSVSGLKDFNRASKDVTAVTELVTTSARSVARGAACTIPSFQPIPVVRPSSPDKEEMSWVPHNNFSAGDSFSTTEMVFHVMYVNEALRQDIIAIRDIMDRHSGEPSWAKLVNLLMDDSGVGFRDGDFLMVNDRIRVGNERQLLACLQYLRNESVLNSEVYVYNLSTVSGAAQQKEQSG
ncbi:uncharacterized protein PV07_00101 [Cladophialophora immunda]|uniref:Uncharacterized protein n=1 Tax=Cladophialophora immunda TaxID=569365 RepID=A0A0D2CTI3_9EURO|nr:uncharacterized protein PV07_00101 [Cladophialophora immunda]KIW33235.1 hypothetical protein PV07_00101 [Cladophialophora immunda]